MVNKNFDTWNIHKKNLELVGPEKLVFHEREIWWASIGINIGDEQDGKNELFERPILVLKKFNSRVAWVLPMTTKEKNGPYYFSITHDDRVFSIILSQLRLLSVRRFRRFVRKISPQQHALIQNSIIRIIKNSP